MVRNTLLERNPSNQPLQNRVSQPAEVENVSEVEAVVVFGD
jgi:hypothetical protein